MASCPAFVEDSCQNRALRKRFAAAASFSFERGKERLDTFPQLIRHITKICLFHGTRLPHLLKSKTCRTSSKVFLDGGWGVDALLGYQSRAHNDIDIFVEKNDYQNFIEIMKANGFYEIKMEYTTLNHTVWEDLKNRIIDLHCFEYTDEGEILYDGDCFPVETFSGKGRIEEIEVSCIEPYSQVMFHLGYEFDENDAHDVKLLCETLHIEIPNEYR